jgi:hypothetical protein
VQIFLLTTNHISIDIANLLQFLSVRYSIGLRKIVLCSFQPHILAVHFPNHDRKAHSTSENPTFNSPSGIIPLTWSDMHGLALFWMTRLLLLETDCCNSCLRQGLRSVCCSRRGKREQWARIDSVKRQPCVTPVTCPAAPCFLGSWVIKRAAFACHESTCEIVVFFLNFERDSTDTSPFLSKIRTWKPFYNNFSVWQCLDVLERPNNESHIKLRSNGRVIAENQVCYSLLREFVKTS